MYTTALIILLLRKQVKLERAKVSERFLKPIMKSYARNRIKMLAANLNASNITQFNIICQDSRTMPYLLISP